MAIFGQTIPRSTADLRYEPAIHPVRVAPGFSKRVKEVLAHYKDSINALFKATGVQRATLVLWRDSEDDIVPQDSTLRKFLEGTGVSEEWLIDGVGKMGTPRPYVPSPPRKRLTPASPQKPDDNSESLRVEEAQAADIEEQLRLITEHGDPADVEMIRQMLGAALRRIEALRGASGRGKRLAKYGRQ